MASARFFMFQKDVAVRCPSVTVQP